MPSYSTLAAIGLERECSSDRYYLHPTSHPDETVSTQNSRGFRFRLELSSTSFNWEALERNTQVLRTLLLYSLFGLHHATASLLTLFTHTINIRAFRKICHTGTSVVASFGASF